MQTDNPRKRRLFIAIELSDYARQILADHIGRLRQQRANSKLKWEAVDKLHLTLKFLGDTAEDQLAPLQKELAGIGDTFRPFVLSLSATGVFPSPQRARVLWVGLEDPTQMLSEIHHRIEKRCSHLGFKSEKRDFAPHVTIARVGERSTASASVEDHLNARLEPVDFEAREIVLFESVLRPSGSIYTPLCRFRFRGLPD